MQLKNQHHAEEKTQQLASANDYFVAIDNSSSKDEIKSIMEELDKKFRGGLIILNEKDWPILSSRVQKRISMPFYLPKRCWQVALICGTRCTMIIEDPCSAAEALQHAKDRFDNRVINVN